MAAAAGFAAAAVSAAASSPTSGYRARSRVSPPHATAREEAKEVDVRVDPLDENAEVR
jgi:hypothetical protein